MKDDLRPDFVPNLINAEPPIFSGLTMDELKVIALSRLLISFFVCFLAVTLIYPHVLTYVLGCLAAGFLTATLIKIKARQTTMEKRGRDPFYSYHKGEIEKEKFFLRWNILPRKSNHHYLVEDRIWSPR
ncbi:DUF3487 family protein [Vibrio vulnificus]